MSQPVVRYLSTRTSKPNDSDWLELLIMTSFSKGARDNVFTIEVSDLQDLKWYVDAAFAVHPYLKSHTGIVFTLGKRTIISGSTKQKMNTRSSTEAELVGVDDVIQQTLWTRQFVLAQGYELKEIIVQQDNLSTMMLATKGTAGSSNRMRHFDIRLFFIKDKVDSKEVSLQYTTTTDLTADYS